MARMRGIFAGITTVAALLGSAAPEALVSRPAAAVEFEMSEAVVVTLRGRFPLHVELAVTPAQRAQGLQHRAQLPPGTGMLFHFGELAPAAMWMKNTLIPLDMVFLDADGRVVKVAADTTPLSLEPIPSGGPVLGVLELPAGSATRMGMVPGARVLHPLFDGSMTEAPAP